MIAVPPRRARRSAARPITRTTRCSKRCAAGGASGEGAGRAALRHLPRSDAARSRGAQPISLIELSRSKGSAIQSWNATASRCSKRWPGRWRSTMHRQLDEKTLVAGQIRPEDVPALKELGVTLIVNNRPDFEDAGQPEGDIEAAARRPGSIIAMSRSRAAWGRPTSKRCARRCIPPATASCSPSAGRAIVRPCLGGGEERGRCSARRTEPDGQ